MLYPVISLYRFFSKRKAIFYLFLLLSTAIIFLLASRIKFEEDISRMTGGNDTANRFEYVTSHHQFAEKLIIRFSMADSLTEADPDSLAAIASVFTDSLSRRFDSTFIREIRGSVPDSLISVYLDFFYENLPLYLDDNDYSKIEGWLNEDTLGMLMKRNYHSLVTPAGFALKRNISRDPLGLTFLALKKLQSLQAGDNYDLVNGFVFTKDHRNLLLFIIPANPPGETAKNSILIKGVEEILANISHDEKISTGYFGAVAMAVGNAAQLKKDIILTLTIALLLIVLVLAWYFRSIKLPLLGFLPAIFGGAFALAVLYVAKGNMSTIALGIGSVILGLIVDYALYLATKFRKSKNIETAISELTPAILLCALTSAGAFLCLVFLKSQVLHDLGWFAALSVTGAALFSIIFLPHFLTLKTIGKDNSENLADRLTNKPYEKNVFILTFIVIAIILGFIFRNKAGFVKDMMSMNFTTEKLASEQEKLERISDVSLKNIYVVSTGKTLEDALEENEKAYADIQPLKNRGIITTVSGISSLLLSDSLQKERIIKWKDFWSPERQEKLRSLMISEGKKHGFRESAFTSSFTLFNDEYKSVNDSIKENLINLFLRDHISRNSELVMITTVVSVTPENKQHVHEKLPSSGNRVVFDRQQLTEKFVAGIRSDFVLLVNLSMIFVTALLLISFGRFEIAFLTALPMYASWIITLGFMGITGINFNIFNIILSSFIFGLGVDYSILMMRGMLNGYKYGNSDMSSYKVSVFLSALTTIIGVASLFFAKHPALSSIALISVVGVASVVLVTFTLQPYLFRAMVTNRTSKGKHPITLRIFVKTLITWMNIVLVAVILFISNYLLIIFPLRKKKKQYLFHLLFSHLSRIYIRLSFPTNRTLINTFNEDFRKPAIIISNHQSLIETPLYLMLHPKILILTSDWVWNSPLFGPIAKMASFFNAEQGLDQIMDKLQEKVSEGYSILVFPEAHRSLDGRIQRFHRGAFYMAEKLHLDILPVVVFGTGEFLGKGAFWGRHNAIFMKVLKRISPDDCEKMGTNSDRAKAVRRLYKEEYLKIQEEYADARHFRKKLILNYIYKGPVLEWYLRIKMKLANNYDVFDRLIPRSGQILDIGCGYGYIAYMLLMTSKERVITGVDHDEEKIRVASASFLKNNSISFVCEDITKYPIEPSDAFLLSDVLHYLPGEQQEKLLRSCISNLKDGGVIVIRDADADKEKNHRRSKFTEFMSTRVIGFNKTSDPEKTLTFTSVGNIRAIAEEYGLQTKIIEEAEHTSNTLLVIRK